MDKYGVVSAVRKAKDLEYLDKLGKELVQTAIDNCHQIVRLTQAF